jgi:hypothetical protein
MLLCTHSLPYLSHSTHSLPYPSHSTHSLPYLSHSTHSTHSLPYPSHSTHSTHSLPYPSHSTRAASPNRYVYQAVHQLFEGTPDREWQPEEKRVSRMVFIGRELDGEAFEEALRNCLAKPEGVREVEVVA